jgi:hypothetical protein
LASVNYTHYWTDTLRRNAAFSYWHQDKQTFDELSDRLFMFKDSFTAHGNLIWSPVPNTNFGVEYIWMKGRLTDGQTGELNRVQVSAQFSF